MARTRAQTTRMVQRTQRYIRDPGSHIAPFRRELIEVRNISQKLVSHKESWTVHSNPHDANRDRDSNGSSSYWKEYGRHWKGRYRINIYLKVPN